MSNESFAYKSFIKNVYIELPKGYTFKHRSLGNSEDHFLGRKTIIRDFLNVLMNGQERGAYLVTGYRGMGKTSFVRQVINSYEQEKKKQKGKDALPVKRVNISLAQTQVKETDILKYIVNQLVEDIKTFSEYSFIRRIAINTIFSWGWPILTITLIVANYAFIYNYIENEHKPESFNTLVENLIGLVSLSGLLTLLAYTAINWVFTKPFGKGNNSRRAKFKVIFEELSNLQLRCSAQVTSEDSLRETFSASAMALFKKDTKTYSIASPREIETALISIMTQLKEFKEYIFIFDELDKIESSVAKNFNEESEKDEKILIGTKTYLDDLRERRHLITNILSALKFFINETEARFIFIAGREMFEASLADISDRQSSISSIFHRVIYIDSFLKDNSEKGNSALDIGTLVESFIESIIFPDSFIDILNSLSNTKYKETDLLSKYYIYQILIQKFDIASDDNTTNNLIKEVHKKENTIRNIKKVKQKKSWFNIYYGLFDEYDINKLQNEIDNINNILTKKKNSYIESVNTYLKETESGLKESKSGDFDLAGARKVIFVLQNFIMYLVYRSNGSPRKMVKLFEEYIIMNTIQSMERAKRRSIIINPYANFNNDREYNYQYLYFPYFTQYKLGFNSYLFQPLLTMYSSFIKRYSDNTLVSIPYLIDNLIKFHPTAFSIHNLELLPEILSTNKSPISRPFLEELVSFLGQNHIRRTEAGIFEYKFYDKTHNEIIFISKIFEDEAAAYNFTLDENYPIKQHLIEKIKLLRASHKEIENTSGNPVSSIIYLNRLLGDVRFQDEEYEDAIISYQDAIQMISKDNLKSLNYLISFIRIKLKLGLTYEKIKAYEFALGHYSSVIEECIKQLTIKKPEPVYSSRKDKFYAESYDPKDSSEGLPEGQLNIYRELMFFVLQAHMAILYLQEKLYEGITFQKVNYIYSSLYNLIDQYGYSYNNRDIILASGCNNIGTILYYKNMPPSHSLNKLLLSYSKKFNSSKPTITVLERKTLREAISKAFPENLDKGFVMQTLEELVGKLDTNNTDSRVCSTSIIYYKYALKLLLGVKKDEIDGVEELEGSLIIKDINRKNIRRREIKEKIDNNLASKEEITELKNIDDKIEELNKKIKNERKKDTIKYLLKQCPALIYKVKETDTSNVSYRSSQHRRYLTSIGHTLAKIADAYLPLIKNKNVDVKEALGCFWYSEFELVKHNLKASKDYEIYAREKLLWDYYGDQDSLFGIENDNINQALLPPRFVLHMYYLASLFFLDAGDTANGSFQLRKILFSLRAIQFSKLKGENEIRIALKCLETNLVRRILELSSWMSHSSDRPQLAKFKKNFNIGTLRTPHSISNELYANVSNNSETKEAILSYTLLKIQHSLPIYGSSLEDCSQRIPESKLVSSYNSISHQIARMMELELQTSLNYKLLTDYFQVKINLLTAPEGISGLRGSGFKLIGENSWESTYYDFSKLYDLELGSFDRQRHANDEENFNIHVIAYFDRINELDSDSLKNVVNELAQLTVNSIFNLTQIANICNTFGVNYIVSYSYLASCHKNLGFWLKFLHLCRFLNVHYKLLLKFNGDLRDLVGNQASISLDTLTHYQIALQHYYSALQMHKEGDTYSLQTNNMLYLEDDFNDNLYHFGAALERLKINSGSIRKQIKALKAEINKANMHKYSAYTGESGIDIHPISD